MSVTPNTFRAFQNAPESAWQAIAAADDDRIMAVAASHGIRLTGRKVRATMRKAAAVLTDHSRPAAEVANTMHGLRPRAGKIVSMAARTLLADATLAPNVTVVDSRICDVVMVPGALRRGLECGQYAVVQRAMRRAFQMADVLPSNGEAKIRASIVHLHSHILGKGFHMAIGGAGTNHHVIHHISNLPDI